MAKSGMKLYSYWRSSCAWRVRTVLAFKGIDYDYEAVHLVNDGGEQYKDAYKAVNPMSQVPALQLPTGEILAESVSIMEFLEETHPEKSMLPKDPLKRARVRQICEIIVSGIQPLQNLRVIFKLPEAERIPWCKSAIEHGFNAVEKILEETAGEYCVGDEVTLADCCLVPQVYNGRMRFEVDISKYPNIHRIDAALAKLDAFKKAHPDNQPDCPKKAQ